MIGQPRPPSKPSEVPELFIQVTKPELDVLIANSQLEIGQLYKVMGVDDNWCNVFLKAIETNELERKGTGEFLVPDYNNYAVYSALMTGQMTDIVGQFFEDEELSTDVLSTLGRFRCNSIIECEFGNWQAATQITGSQSGATATISGFTTPNYPLGTIVVRDNQHFQSLGGDFYNDINANNNLNLDSNWTPTNVGMTVNFDQIEYDYNSNKIIYRKDSFNNEVSDLLVDEGSGGNIKKFRWNDFNVRNNVLRGGNVNICNALQFFLFTGNKCENWNVDLRYILESYFLDNDAVNVIVNNNRGIGLEVTYNKGEFAISSNVSNFLKFDRNAFNTCNVASNAGNNILIEKTEASNLNMQNNKGDFYTISNCKVKEIEFSFNTGSYYKLYNNTGSLNYIYANNGSYYFVENTTTDNVTIEYGTMAFCFFENNTGNIMYLNGQSFQNKTIKNIDFKNGDINVSLLAATFFFQSYPRTVFQSNQYISMISYFDSVTNAEVYNLVEA